MPNVENPQIGPWKHPKKSGFLYICSSKCPLSNENYCLIKPGREFCGIEGYGICNRRLSSQMMSEVNTK